MRLALALSCTIALGCASTPASEPIDTQGLDALNARFSEAYRQRDPDAYGRLYTSDAVFEWPAIPPVRGSEGLAAMARGLWATQRDLELRVHVASRTMQGPRATEFGAFELSWNDTTGVRRTEYGRYASVLVRQPDRSWRMARWLGFEDSVRVVRR